MAAVAAAEAAAAAKVNLQRPLVVALVVARRVADVAPKGAEQLRQQLASQREAHELELARLEQERLSTLDSHNSLLGGAEAWIYI